MKNTPGARLMAMWGGNLRSRFTDFLGSDGEKAWRDREAEFRDDFPEGEAGRQAALEAWHQGFAVLEATLASLSDDDLGRTVTIRGVPQSVAFALARAVAHLGYHQGQITLIARIHVGPSRWTSISIPRGASELHNASLGFRPAPGGSERGMGG